MTNPLERLGEQDRRRRAGVPTLSVLIGPVGLGGACWRRWCALSGRPAVWRFSANLPHLTAAWTTRLAEQRDLTADAAAWAAATVGLFVMNAEMDFPFGHRKAELDFAARSLKIAIEVDGWFHFQDPEAYRRDRRKDWELQRRGYLVLRFLAEDVVPKLEDVLDTILTAVAWRRESGCEKEQSC